MNLYTKGESLSPIFQQSSRHGVAWGGGGVKGGLGVGGGSAAQESHSSCPPPPPPPPPPAARPRPGGRDVISQDLHCPMRKKF
jgi:hypothetical protein